MERPVKYLSSFHAYPKLSWAEQLRNHRWDGEYYDLKHFNAYYGNKEDKFFTNDYHRISHWLENDLGIDYSNVDGSKFTRDPVVLEKTWRTILGKNVSQNIPEEDELPGVDDPDNYHDFD